MTLDKSDLKGYKERKGKDHRLRGAHSSMLEAGEMA
jgi:hypothetical protein